MTPQQLRQSAAFIRERYPYPVPTMTPGRYVSCEALRTLANALEHLAQDAPVVPGWPSTEGDGGAPDDLHALLDFVWFHTTEEASGLVSLQGSEVQREAESYLDEHGGELLRWEHQVLTLTMRIASAERQKREAGR